MSERSPRRGPGRYGEVENDVESLGGAVKPTGGTSSGRLPESSSHVKLLQASMPKETPSNLKQWPPQRIQTLEPSPKEAIVVPYFTPFDAIELDDETRGRGLEKKPPPQTWASLTHNGLDGPRKNTDIPSQSQWSPRSAASLSLEAATISKINCIVMDESKSPPTRTKKKVQNCTSERPVKSTPRPTSSLSLDAAIMSKMNRYRREKDAKESTVSQMVDAKKIFASDDGAYPQRELPDTYMSVVDEGSEKRPDLSINKPPTISKVTEPNQVTFTTPSPGAVLVRPSGMSEPPVSYVDDRPHSETSESGIDEHPENEDIIEATMLRDTDIVEATTAVSAKTFRRRRITIFLAAFVVVGAIVGVAVGLTIGDSDGTVFLEATPSPTATPVPTLMRVAEEGVLRCGVTDKVGFSFENEDSGVREGFDVDLCRAVAAAALGETYQIETVVYKSPERFVALAGGEVDLLARVTTHTMSRDVFEKSAGVGFSFAAPYLYDGLAFGGISEYLACANELNTLGDCEDLRVCVVNGTTHIDIIDDLLPNSIIRAVPTNADTIAGLTSGLCNVVAGETFDISEPVVRREGYNGPYEVGSSLFSKEPLALVTREDDAQWTDFVSSVFLSLLVAEAEGIIQAQANTFPNTSLFGDDFEHMFVDAIGAVGNYGQIYTRHLEAFLPRQGLNVLSKNSNTGLIYSHPFGRTWDEGHGPTEGGTLERILNRQKVQCGIISREGFGVLDPTTNEWTGLNVDYCRALSASIFGRATDQTLELFLLSEKDDPFSVLANGEIDALCGAPVSIGKDAQGFSFSQPYFYEPSLSDGNPYVKQAVALVSRHDDPQWSDFIYWVVASTFFAEEEGITQALSPEMPLVNLFGSAFSLMFRDVISIVGNYGELYSRNVEAFVPRNGTNNMLNLNPPGPQLFPYPGL